MSQEKAQLIAPIGIMTVTGMTATGVITATSFTGNIVGSAKSLVNGSNVSVGVITATSFDGNLTGNILRLADSAPNIVAGVTTATSFVGNLTGSVTDLTSAPAITVGMVTATALEGPVTGNITGDITGNVSGVATGNVTGNVSGIAELGLGINYNGGWTGAGTSQINAGVVTATTFYGDGSTLDGVSSGPVSQQSIGITSATTTIDLSNGNLIRANQSANTTVSFANTSNGNVYIIREKDDTGIARTITWPDRIKWDGGTPPTLINNLGGSDLEGQVFLLVTRDMGVTWYGKEVVNYDTYNKYELWSWGYFRFGSQADNAPSEKRSSPVQVAGGKLFNTFSGDFENVGIVDNTLWTWGYNNKGMVGDNTIVSRSSPTQVPGTTWSSGIIVNPNNGSVLATKKDNTLWAWGSNEYVELGQNSKGDDRSSPVQIPGTWTATAGGIWGGYSSFALKPDGTMWSWGYNNDGRLGHNDMVQYSSPMQIGTDTTWSSGVRKNSGGTSNASIKTDGTLWVWGSNDWGALGQNDRTVYSSPIQVPGTTWDKCSSVGQTHAYIKTDGTLWVCGRNNDGELGINSKDDNRSSPVQIPGTSWSDIMVGAYHMAAMKTDNTLWIWGDAEGKGVLGLNEADAFRSSPVQIPGTNWTMDYVIGSTRNKSRTNIFKSI